VGIENVKLGRYESIGIEICLGGINYPIYQSSRFKTT
jgi:hypothetical protein